MPDKINGGHTTPLQNYTTPAPSSGDSQPTRRPNERSTGGASLTGLQDLSTPHTRRQEVTEQSAAYMGQSNATYYSAAVHHVSSTLQSNGFGITPGSRDSVLGNLHGISQGTQTHTGAHMTESKSFGTDALGHLQRGEYRDGAVTAFGSALNAAASMTVGPARDFEAARHSSNAWDASRATASLHQDFETLPSPKHE
ncbi:hypothetical protein [Burkholderia stagnalis]|uniref:hypothetical protein n=1 Tax=Burkholderia stagnalis TaxID=1503054 RepID=UPI000A67881E|nr:hypothetical protein [Burkholderia stagnalis]